MDLKRSFHWGEHLLETITVGVSMSGTTGIGESLRVIQLLDELGKL